MAEFPERVTKSHSVTDIGFKGSLPDNNSLSCAFVLCGSLRLIYFTFNKVKIMTASWCIA